VEPHVKSKDHQSTIIVPDADAFEGKDISPGSCDVKNLKVSSEGECAKACAEAGKCKAYVIDHSKSPNVCYLKSCTSPLKDRDGHKSFIPKSIHPAPPPQPQALTQKSVRVYPTRTIIELELPGVMAVTVTTLNTMFPDDLLKMSMPTTTIKVDVRSLDGKKHTVEAYLEALASHTVDDLDEEVVDEEVDAAGDDAVENDNMGSEDINDFNDNEDDGGEHINQVQEREDPQEEEKKEEAPEEEKKEEASEEEEKKEEAPEEEEKKEEAPKEEEPKEEAADDKKEEEPKPDEQ